MASVGPDDITEKLTEQQCMLWRTQKSNINLGNWFKSEALIEKNPQIINQHKVNSSSYSIFPTVKKPPFLPLGYSPRTLHDIISSHLHTALRFILHQLCLGQLPVLSIFSRATTERRPVLFPWTSSYTCNKPAPRFSLKSSLEVVTAPKLSKVVLILITFSLDKHNKTLPGLDFLIITMIWTIGNYKRIMKFIIFGKIMGSRRTTIS